MEGPAAEDSHPRLAVPNRPAGGEGENAARETIHHAALHGHRGEIAEAVSDDQVGLARRREQRGDRRRGMLPVRVDHDHRLGRVCPAEEAFEPSADGAAFPGVARQPQELGAGLLGELLELPRDPLRRAVVDDQQTPRVPANLVHEPA
jgi:hypothetical protein